MKQITLVTLLLAFGAVAKADSVPPQDTFSVTYGDSCDASLDCAFSASWDISETSQPCCTVLTLLGYSVPISSADITPPVPGFAFSDIFTITDPFDVNASCDAGTNELICDEEILGIYTDGAPYVASALPFFSAVSSDPYYAAEASDPPDPPADPASDPLVVATPEPSALALAIVGIGFVGIMWWRRKIVDSLAT